jgi:hypothetical protein
LHLRYFALHCDLQLHHYVVVLEFRFGDKSMPMYRHAATTPAERELTQAVRRVIERYGSDLSGYFRHVEEIAKKNTQRANTQTVTQDSTEGKGDDESASQS